MKKIVLYIAFLTSLIAMLGSLFFSNVLNFPPCILCWYQRICMYPMVLLLAIGIIRQDKKVYTYVLPLSIIGICIGIYHNLLYYSILPESIAPCQQGVSCTTKFIELFGFITIPLLSTIGFAIITACMLVYKRATDAKVLGNKKEKIHAK